MDRVSGRWIIQQSIVIMKGRVALCGKSTPSFYGYLMFVMKCVDFHIYTAVTVGMRKLPKTVFNRAPWYIVTILCDIIVISLR